MKRGEKGEAEPKAHTGSVVIARNGIRHASISEVEGRYPPLQLVIFDLYMCVRVCARACVW
jgi:hypothetical protein